ncbi:MAG TPA: FkbM family methyltransferase [Verrucomicrobiae bacterium]|nr:FkbM family methyltransferase [Verrucomicrobiae bacterium]
MTFQSLADSARRGLRRPEVRRHPVHAVARRVAWRWHWKRHPGVPILLKDWWRGMSIELPHTGNAALVYYRCHADPLQVHLMEENLKPGMTVLDIGAHIGAYTLVAAKAVGQAGRVHAIEPLPPCVRAIRRNAEINGFGYMHGYEAAIGERAGTVCFQSDPERTAGWMTDKADATTFETPCWTLDEFCKEHHVQRVDFIKLDAGSNELAALRGGEATLNGKPKPILLAKLYHPRVTEERFHYRPHETVALLLKWGYKLTVVIDERDQRPITSPEQIDSCFDPLIYTRLLLATGNAS